MNKRLDQSHIQERLRRLEEGRGIDWSTAEALAIGTLLLQGRCVTLKVSVSYTYTCIYNSQGSMFV